jgi:hypothetical protein
LRRTRPERRAVVEQDDEDDPPGHVGEEHRLALALVEERREVLLADQLRQLVVGAEVGRRQRRERGGVEGRRLADRAHQLPARSTRRAQRALLSYRKRCSDPLIARKSSSVNDQLTAPEGMPRSEGDGRTRLAPRLARERRLHRGQGLPAPPPQQRVRLPAHVVAESGPPLSTLGRVAR